jgi:hypothetical protein
MTGMFVVPAMSIMSATVTMSAKIFFMTGVGFRAMIVIVMLRMLRHGRGGQGDLEIA